MSEQSQAPVPPVPQYGEYAPTAPGYVPPPAAPAYPAAPPAPAYQGGVPMTGAPKRRKWDFVLTIVLLGLGFFGMLLGLLFAAVFASPELDTQFSAQGLNVDLDFGVLPQVIVISHVVLYLLVLGLSIPLLIRGKIVVFWIPLTAGVIAAAILWGGYFAVFYAALDPSDLANLT